MGKQKKANPGTYQITLTGNALGNIDEIAGYIAFINHQPMNAIKVGDAIMAAIENWKCAFSLQGMRRAENKIENVQACDLFILVNYLQSN